MTIARDTETVGRLGIGGLIEDLRRQGFAVSTSEAIDATQLVIVMSRKERTMDPERLGARLRPVFCKTREEQESFDAIFREWYQFTEPEPAAQAPVVKPGEPPRANKPRWPFWTAIALVIVAGTIAAIWFNWEPAGQPKTGTFHFGGGQSGGGGSTGDLPTGDFIKSPPTPPSSAVLGYFPRLRYNNELRPLWGWLLAALPLAALTGFSIPALVIRRARAGRRSEPMYLDRRELEEEARRVVPPLRPEISAKLARHLRGSPEGDFRLTRRPILDVRATVEKTLRNRGIPSPQYRHTHTSPSYLLLIDVANQRDPRGRLFYQWAERLQRERLQVEIALVRLHEGEPQFRPTSRGELPRDESGWMPLRRLPEPPFGQRLLLVSAGELLAEADGKWRAQASAARLHRWRQRAMFTPIEPRDWGVREEAIERAEHTADPGFVVLPLDESALSAWTDLLTAGQLSEVVLTEPQRFPGVLRRGKANDFNKDEHPPDPKTLEKLIAQLRIYLGDVGFTWLAALAIPPLVRWELTVLLGRDVIQRIAERERKDVNLVLSRNYRRLVRLPWLQRETMPNWLRLRLLAELPGDTHEKLREIVEKLLGKLSPTPPKSDAIELGFERPPGSDTTGASRSASDDADPLYLGYMSGLSPRQLAMRAPKEWGKWLGKMRVPRPRGVRGFFVATADYARSWWARLVFRGGSPFSGLRRGPLIASSLLVLLASGCLWFVARHDRYWWPESMDSWLFDEQAHAIAFHHAAAVRTASFSPDGLRILTASDDGTARVWDVKTGRAVTPPLQHPGAVVDAKWSPDGSVVATASGQVMYFWDAARGNRTRSWSVRGTRVGDIRRFEFNRTGTRVVVVGGNVAHVLDLITNRAIPLSHNAEINRAVFDLNDRVITASDDASARLWSPDGTLLFSLPHGSPVLDSSFTKDGTVAMTADRNGRIRLWVTTTGRLYEESWLSPGGIVHAEFNSSGRQIAARVNGAAVIWKWVDHAPPLILNHAGLVLSASFSSDEQRVLTASLDGTARVWDATTGRPIGSPLRHERALTAASFNHDGTRIVTASEDGMARIWEAVNEEPDVKPLRHKTLLRSVAFDASGRRVLTTSTNTNSARVWDAVSGVRLSPDLAHGGTVWSGVFNPGGDRVATAADDAANIWDWRTGKRTASPLRHQKGVLDAEFSPDGRQVVTASYDGTSRIWDSAVGSPLTVPMRHRDAVMSARFSPDGHYVVTASLDHTGQIWEAATGRPIGKPLTHAATLVYAAFSPNGRFVVTASLDNSARIWDVPGGTPRTPQLLHRSAVRYAIFDPVGRVVMTASDDSTARLWNASTGGLLHELRHDGNVSFAAFTPDGTRVATASDDGTSRLWEVATGRLLAPPMRHHSEVFRVAFSPDGKRVITGPAYSIRTKYIALPSEYVAPADSAQIWHVPPYPPPDAASQPQALRRRASLALQSIAPQRAALTIAIAAIAVLVPVLLVALRRRRQLENLAQGAAS